MYTCARSLSPLCSGSSLGVVTRSGSSSSSLDWRLALTRRCMMEAGAFRFEDIVELDSRPEVGGCDWLDWQRNSIRD